MSTHKLSCLCFASYKYSHHSIIIGKSFGYTFSATTSFQFVSWRVCIMTATRAWAITTAAKAVYKSRENEKRCKSAARKRKWHERQSAEQRSEIRQTDLTGHAEGCACLSEERQSEIRQTDLTGHAEGHACLSEKRQSEIRQTHWTGHAEGPASLSAERRSEIRQTNQTRHAEGRTRLSEEQHAENSAHHLNLLLLNNFCSNFVFVINYHAARQIIERPCHLLLHVVNNSKLTTLAKPKKVTAKLAKNFGGKMNHWKTCQGPCNLVSQHDMIYFGARIGAVKYHLLLRALCTKRNAPLLICSTS